MTQNKEFEFTIPLFRSHPVSNIIRPLIKDFNKALVLYEEKNMNIKTFYKFLKFRFMLRLTI
jgi:hypothetical protein